MCQPKDKGGRRCPVHQPASVGLRRLATASHDLEDGQVLHVFRRLRESAPAAPDPSEREYRAFVGGAIRSINASGLDDKTKKSIVGQLQKRLTEGQLPDGPTFHALRNLHIETLSTRTELDKKLSSVATAHGISKDEARRAFHLTYNSTVDIADSSSRGVLDARSTQVIAALTPEITEDGTPLVSNQPRIAHIDNTFTGARNKPIKSYGYDPDDGRLEVKLWNGKTVAMHNIPEYTWQEIQRGGISITDVAKLQKRPEFAYGSEEEADRAGYATWCLMCKRYRVQGHTCMVRAAEDRDYMLTQALLNRGTSFETEYDRQLIASIPKSEVRERLEQLSKAVESAEEPEEDKPRLQRAPEASSGVQARWNTPVEDRAVTYDRTASDEDQHSVISYGHHYNIYVTGGVLPEELRSAVLERGELATVTVGGNMKWGDDGAGTQRADVTFAAVGDRGDIQYTISNLRCTCEVYRRNYTCSHVRSGQVTLSLDENTEALERIHAGIDRLHRDISLSSFLRTPRRDGTERNLLLSSGAREYRDTSDSISDELTIGRPPTKKGWDTVREALKNNGKVNFDVERSMRFIDAGYMRRWDVDYRNSNSDRNHAIGTIGIALDDEGNPTFDWSNYRCPRCREQIEDCECSNVYGTRRSVSFDRNRDAMEEWMTNRILGIPEGSKEEKMTVKERAEYLAGATEQIHTLADSIASEEEGEGTYTSDIDAYIKDVKDAAKRRKDGEPIADFEVTEAGEVTGGLCSPGTNRYFGLELEYMAPNDWQSRQAIAREMHEAGLSDISHATHYHGYQGSRWHIESDATVSGEVVSPKLQDTPEDWAQVEQVINIIKRNGGEVSTKAGGHIHMGIKDSDRNIADNKTRVAQVYARYRDEARRVQTAPSRGKHRGEQWCEEVSDPLIQRALRQENTHYRGDDKVGTIHSHELNMSHQGRVEFRAPDGSLDLGHIKANVAMAAGFVRIAESNEEISTADNLRSSKVGSGAKLMQAMSGRNKYKPTTKDEMIVADAGYRSFLDRVMPNEKTRRAGASLAAANGWQRK